MGEAKRKQQRKTPEEIAAELLTHRLANEGRLIEAGWASLRAAWLPPDFPPEYVERLRWAFMAGAQHLLASIIITLDPEAEPTLDDLKRMELIQVELDRFAQEAEFAVASRGAAAQGTA